MMGLKLVKIKSNIDGIPIGSIGYVKDYFNGLYEVYIPEYNETLYLTKDEFE